jgi:hypothetical protein
MFNAAKLAEIGVSSLHLREGDAALALVFATAIFVGGFADVILIGLEEDDLGDALVGVDLRR